MTQSQQSQSRRHGRGKIRVIVKMGIDGGVGLAKSANRDKIKTS